MVEQLGLAMMPPCPYLMPFIASGFTSGMTRGTPSVILNAELLSTTCTPNIKITAVLFQLKVSYVHGGEKTTDHHKADGERMLTVQPASDATGPSFLLMDPPALNKAMSTPLKLQVTHNIGQRL